MRCPCGVVTILALGVLLTACAGDARGSQPSSPSIPRQTASSGDYELRPAAGWHVAGRVTARPAPHGDRRLDIAVVGPDAEVMQRFMWHVAALRCDEWGTFAPQPKRYLPGTTIERSPILGSPQSQHHGSPGLDQRTLQRRRIRLPWRERHACHLRRPAATILNPGVMTYPFCQAICGGAMMQQPRYDERVETSAFRVVDLTSQAGKEARHVQGWRKGDILAWLSQFGELKQPISDNPDLYVLYSPSGLLTGFLLTEEGEIFIIADHTTYRPG